MRRNLVGHHLPQLRHLQHINVHTYARTHRRTHTHACNMHANRLDFLFCLLLLFMHCKLPAGRDTCCCRCCCACVGVAVVSAACGALNFFAFRCHCRCQQPQLPHHLVPFARFPLASWGHVSTPSTLVQGALFACHICVTNRKPLALSGRRTSWQGEAEEEVVGGWGGGA